MGRKKRPVDDLYRAIDVHFGEDEEEIEYPEFEEIVIAKQPGLAQRVDAILEDFQLEAVDALEDHFLKKDEKAGFLCLATGGGKTRTTLEFLFKHFISKRKRVLWITHRIELLNQVHEEIRGLAALAKKERKKFTISRVDGRRFDFSGDIVLASVQTLLKQECRYTDFVSRTGGLKFACYDEAHRTIAPQWLAALEKIARPDDGLVKKEVPILGLTATPFRSKKVETRRLQRLFGSKPVYEKSFIDLINVGFLAEPHWRRWELKSLEGITPTKKQIADSKKKGELVPSLLQAAARSEERNEEVVEHWKKERRKFGKTLAFACDIVHAEMLARKYREKRVKAEALHCGMDNGRRQAILERFKNGETEVLVNVGILTEGANLPDTKTVLLARPTMSEVLYIQMIGRGSRGPKTVPGKKVFYVLDCIDNYYKHGLVWAGGGIVDEIKKKLGLNRRGESDDKETEESEVEELEEATAMLLLKSLKTKDYHPWGELRWKKDGGREKSLCVWKETRTVTEDAVKELKNTNQRRGRVKDVKLLAKSLEDDGAMRKRDWEEICNDYEKTGEEPILKELKRYRKATINQKYVKMLADLAMTFKEGNLELAMERAELHYKKDEKLRKKSGGLDKVLIKAMRIAIKDSRQTNKDKKGENE